MEAAIGWIWRKRPAFWFLVPCLFYLAGAAFLSDFIIDDAGISFAYARNFASGNGFVAQPGRPPVEGFSNFLWVLVLSPFFLFGLFHPVWTPKALGAWLVFLSLWLLLRTLRRAGVSALLCLVLGALLALSPPIVIWTTSGLENSLTLLLLVLLYAIFIEKHDKKADSWRSHFQTQCGVLAGLLALTRPDGLVYVGFGIAIAVHRAARTLLQPSGAKAKTWRQVARESLHFFVGFSLIFAPVLALRFRLFGLPFPHPYYAKRVHTSLTESFFAMFRDPNVLLLKFFDVSKGVFGTFGPFFFVLTALFAIFLLARRQLSTPLKTALVLQFISLGGYLWLDDDWMGEYRFATGVVLFSFLSFALEVELLYRSLGRSKLAARGFAIGGSVALAIALSGFWPRIWKFAANPPTQYRDVERSFGAKFNRYAELLRLREASVLLPDVGATLFVSKLTVIDSAGLCEPEIIQTLKKGTHYWFSVHPEFYDLVFEKLRPTFVSTHHFWTYVAAFDADPRFRRDYVAINAYEDAYVMSVFGVKLRSGDFVRRDALANYGDIELLRAFPARDVRADPWATSLHEAATSFFDQHESARGADTPPLSEKLLAERAIKKNDPNRAATLLALAIAKEPSNIELRVLRATVLDDAARTDEARIEWQRALDLVGPTDPSFASLSKVRLFGYF